ncbi:hypothetical protein AAHA92_28964 [Salvia divinorum]|uniref:Uncharacterized protein n=1 Tax=Salvia divinorum TaxID=28513 RepID=A0ABD1FZB0_SALDI
MMNSIYGKRNTNFAFDLGLGSRAMNGKTNPTSSCSSATYASQQSSWSVLAARISMVGDIFGKSRNAPLSSSASVVNGKDPNLFSDLVKSAIGGNKSSSRVPIKNTAPSSSVLITTQIANGFDALFSSTDDGIINEEYDSGGTTTELEGLPPPPAGVSASYAKNKGMDYYKQGQFADAIKWLSWSVALLGDDGIAGVLIHRASCYKEVGEYNKAVADCTKVLDRDGKNVSALVQRALLYESMEKYMLGAEDLRAMAG